MTGPARVAPDGHVFRGPNGNCIMSSVTLLVRSGDKIYLNSTVVMCITSTAYPVKNKISSNPQLFSGAET